jgi:MSHA pilin protein MshD
MGFLLLNTNSTIVKTDETRNSSDFGVTGVSLATSVIEEAMGKMFDAAIEDSNTGQITSPTALTSPSSLGHGSSERYRDPIKDFNDFDDFNNLFIVFKSDNPSDTAKTAGSDWEAIVPGIRSKCFVRARVYYVQPPNLDVVSSSRTWHKKIVVTVTSPSYKDTISIPAIMSYWN